MVDVQEGVIVVLDKAQTSTATHARLLKTLRELHDRTDLHQFLEVFVTPLRAALVVARKEPAVERVLDFAAKFAASVAPLETTAAEEEEEEAGDGGDKEGEKAEDEEEIKRDSGECDESSEDRYPETEEEEEEEEFDENFFNFLLVKVLSFHSASSRAVRFRSCQLVAKMLKCGAERGCWLQSCVLEAVRDVMLERIRDKISTVRVHAVQALELLQEDVLLQEELAGVLERDPSPDVRRTTLNTIVITDHTLPAILSRTRDVKDQIRKEAFWLLAEKCNIRNFRIEQRIKLLNDGLNDRSEMVREACVKGLLHSWSYNVNGDLLALLSKLDVETSPEVAEQALCRLLEEVEVERVVQSTVGLTDPANRLESWGEDEEEEEEEERLKMAVTDRVLPYDLLHSVEAFYWSCVCRYLHKMGDEGDQLMEKILPTLSDFCVYVQQYVERELLPAEGVEEKVQKMFVCQQLLSIFSVVDLSDEVGRERLRKMVLDLLALPGLPLALVSPLLAQQTTLWPQPHTRVEKLLEVIADLQQPPLSTTLSTAAAGGGGGGVPPSSSQSTTLLSEDSQMAALANLSLQDIHTDPDILARCLMIATEMLKEQRLRKLPVNLKTMVDVLVLPSIQSELPDIRDLAFNCLGLACLHDVSLARNHLLLFLQVSQVDHESVQATAVKVVFDLLLLFGFEAFSLASPGSSSKTSHQTDETLVANGEEEGELEEVEGGEMGEIDEEEEEEEEQDGEKEAKEITQRILTIMANFLDGESSVLRGIAGEGLAKLLLNGRVISQKLLARLLILWVDPSTQEEARLRAVLGLFFPTFASSDRSCRVMVGEVFLPVMEAVSEAPAESPLRDVDLNQLADYLIHLCAPREPNEDSVHDSLALSVANAVLSEPENSLLTRIYCLSLTRMQLSTSNKTELLILMDQMQRNVRDKRSLTHIKKVVQSLKNGGGEGGGGGGGEEAEEGGGGEADKDADGEEGREVDGAADDGDLKEEEEEREEVAGEEQEELNDDTIVAPASTPPRPTSPALETTTRHKSTAKKSEVPKSTRKAKASSKKTTTKKKKKKKKRSAFLDSSDEDSSDFSGDGEIPPQQLSALPSRVRSSRAAKMSAQKRISEFSLVVTPRSKKRQEEEEEEESGESDDSLVGEHSPFVRQPVKRTGGGGGRIPVLQYDDDDD